MNDEYTLMKTSVIFTTYNSPTWLEKVLWGFFSQTYRDFEIVIADDGSRDHYRGSSWQYLGGFGAIGA